MKVVGFSVEEGVVFEGFDLGGVDGDDVVDALQAAVEG